MSSKGKLLVVKGQKPSFNGPSSNVGRKNASQRRGFGKPKLSMHCQPQNRYVESHRRPWQRGQCSAKPVVLGASQWWIAGLHQKWWIETLSQNQCSCGPFLSLPRPSIFSGGGFVSGTRAQSTAGNKNRQKICRGLKTRRPGDLCTSLYKNPGESSRRSGCVSAVSLHFLEYFGSQYM